MKTRSFTQSLNILAVISLIAGITNFLQGMPLSGNLTGGGALLSANPSTTEEVLRGAATLYPTTYAGAEAAAQFAFGILLIVLGFFLHALSKMRAEQPVHITVKPTKKRPKNWYWIQVRV